MKIKDGRKTITSEIAYIAGFFDGEGCVRIKRASQRGSSFYVTVTITNSYVHTLRKIEMLFGGKVRHAENGVNKPIYHYELSSSEAVDFLKTVKPFLGEKLEQAILAITFHETKDYLNQTEKEEFAERISALKREVIGNVWENPELISNP